MKNVDYENLTPMMKQYVDLKKEYSDAILMFRMGDFYEMFFDDAIVASKELDIVLTGRDAGIEDKVPMCGVPYHAVDNYINRLINKGYKVAICEQLEDPKEAKGLVKRGVTRVITPGTNLQFSEGDSQNNFLASLYGKNMKVSLSYVDFSTGDLYITYEEENYNNQNSNLRNQLSVLEIKELIVNDKNINIDDIVNIRNILLNYHEEDNLIYKDEYFEFLENLNMSDELRDNLKNNEIMFLSLGQLFDYLKETQFNFLDHIRSLKYIDNSEYMILDKHTLYSLDIFSENERKTEGTLFHLLDKTRTSMGYRKLRYFLEHPLKDENLIKKRLDIVDSFISNLISLDEIRDLLYDIYDIERIMVRISGQSNSPKDLIQLKKALNPLNKIKKILVDIFNINDKEFDFDTLDDLSNLLENSIIEDPPLSPKEGGVIKDGFSDELDDLKNNSINSKSWILNYENELREETGINKLRIKYNKVLGYFVEVTKSYVDKVPDYFIRKQTLVGSERYFTDKLKSTEMTIINSKDKIDSMEFEIYLKVRDIILENYDRIIEVADVIALIDVFSNFAFVSNENDYSKPLINKNKEINIKDGRHPIVEKNVDIFIDNDTEINKDKNFILLTGPNMAGKSTYMRQVALISIMMQIGCFIPASKGTLPVFDRIFTRIGAHDNLYEGESTFMVEMKEMADIIDHATENSLIILDEVGRGTSTYDGLSLAKALIEYIIENIHGITIFATHFHELTDLRYKYSKIKNQTMAVREKGGDIQFLRKVINGTSDKSYGIHVATLAGIKGSIVRKAKVYLNEYERKYSNLEQISIDFDGNNDNYNTVEESSENLKYEEVIDRILDLDLNGMTPIDSMLEIRDLKEMISEIEDE